MSIFSTKSACACLLRPPSRRPVLRRMSFGATTSSRSAGHFFGPTPPGVGPGRYEAPPSLRGEKPGDSTLGSSVFVPGVPGAGAALPGPRRGVPGPGTHRPELCGAIGYSTKPPPRVSTLAAVRKVRENPYPSVLWHYFSASSQAPPLGLFCHQFTHPLTRSHSI